MKRILISLIILLMQPTLYFASDPYDKAREKLVKDEIITAGIKDKRVIDAFLTVPRHLFVVKPYRRYAYIDYPLPIGEGQTISQPSLVALMTESLSLKKTDRVLEIGTGSGYQAAILAHIAKEVYSIEIKDGLAQKASKLVQSLEYKNIFIKKGDGFFGWSKKAPFDAIMITAATPKIPPPLVEQLKEGGCMILPLGVRKYYQHLTILRKVKGKMIRKKLIPVAFVPMVGEVRKR